jgi:hypothetical protein
MIAEVIANSGTTRSPGFDIATHPDYWLKDGPSLNLSRFMFSWSSSANLKIIGTDGHSPASLRNEIERGAKFVIYSYNFSLVVMSFKRPSNVCFVGAGQSRVVKGLPFTLISLVFGWWGFPWGIIYTIQSLHTNLSGGKDVTDSILASLAPPPVEGAVELAARPSGIQRPAQRSTSPRQIMLVAAVIAAFVAVAYASFCIYEGQNLRVALVSGAATPYTVELNGRSYKLVRGHPELLTLSEGDFVLRGAPAEKAEQHFTAETSFLSRPFDRRVLVINPDRTAIVYRETTNYHTEGATPDANEKGEFDLYANRTSYYLPVPDYFFEDFPRRISMPSGTSVIAKSRLTFVNDFSLDARTRLVAEKLGRDAVREYLTSLARSDPEDDMLQRLIITQLKPAEARTLFESRLADRPVLVEWHRAYQFLMDSRFQSVDLLPVYRKWMDAEPDDGALIYLYARLTMSPATERPLYEKALHAKHPAGYAAYALATDAFANGRYAESIAFLQQAEKAGVHSESLQLRKRDSLLALGRFGEVLEEVKQGRTRDATDTELFADELLLSQGQAGNRIAGQRAITVFLAGLRNRFGAGDYEIIQTYLNGRLAYALGEEGEAAGYAATLKGINLFESAVNRRDHAAAAKALAGTAELPVHYMWILMLTAHAAGDAAAADRYFQQAVTILEKTDRYSRAIAAHIHSGTPADHEDILRTANFASELRVLYTALGVQFPAQREMYFARARELDRDPAFPHLLLRAIQQKDASAAAKL